jgi:hypothetical protein
MISCLQLISFKKKIIVSDDQYEYRHVILPRELAAKVPKDHFMSETEWRALGICQSVGFGFVV